jgi:hypothetical protein
VLLLDVDGVLRHGGPWEMPTPSPWPVWEWQQFEFDTDNGDRHVYCSGAVLRFLRYIGDPNEGRPPVEVRWHSTWYDRCRRFLAPALGLPDWPVAVCPEFFYQHGGWAEEMPAEFVYSGAFPQPPERLPDNWWWKLPAAERVVYDEQRPLIWIDDEIAERARADDALRALLQHPDVLAVNPDPALGLAPADLQRISHWLGLDRTWER